MTSTNGQGHTKGPWSAEGPDPFGDYNIHEPSARLAIGAVVSNLRPAKEVSANARLIAAAPDLLEACKGLLTKYDFGDDLPEDHPIVAARAALSRVSGEGR